MKEKIITFDCYGTLLDTSPLKSCLRSIAVENWMDESEVQNLFYFWHDRLMFQEDFMNYEELIRTVLEWMDFEMGGNTFRESYERIIKKIESFQPFPDVVAGLSRLKEKGYQIVVMSNTSRRLMEKHLETMHHLPDLAITADETHCYKPALEFFQYAQTLLSLHKKDHVHAASRYWKDIVPAAKMGWDRIWINRNCLPHPRKQEEPMIMFYNLTDFLEF